MVVIKTITKKMLMYINTSSSFQRYISSEEENRVKNEGGSGVRK